MTTPRFMRPIRSFVRREGRLTPGQQRAMDALFPAMGLTADHGWDMAQIFGNDHPVCLEIGFGMGASLAMQAAQNPDMNYIGVEVHKPGIGACLIRVEEYGLTNLRVCHHDVVEVINGCLPDHGLHGVQIFFPDPWHKKRHNKRRLVQGPFLDKLLKKLAIGGYLHLATDWEHYAEQMLSLVNDMPGLVNQSADNAYIPRPESRPLTKFEQRGKNLGHGVWDIYCLKQ